MTPPSAIDAVELAWQLEPGAELSPEQDETLSGFLGWGALAPAFAAQPTGQWLTLADRLDEALPANALRSASEQVDTSFFTPTLVTDAVYSLLRAVGFTAGRVLEPGCGSGAFMRAAPEDLDIEWTGVEIDPTSARIARLRNPAATIIEGPLEKVALRDNHYDAVVGNVPFSSVRVGDTLGRYASLHNYFVLRSAEAVRPGGYVIVVTSRHTMDSEEGIVALVKDLPEMAFVGAMRLPAGVFDGTGVVTDIIALRRNDSATTLPPSVGRPNQGARYEDRYYGRTLITHDDRPEVTAPAPGVTEGVPARVATYFADNPAHVAGSMRVTGFARSPLTVVSTDFAGDIAAAVGALSTALPPMSPPDDPADLDDVVLFDPDGRKEGSFHLTAEGIVRIENGKAVPVRANKELSALVALRDLAVALLTAEADYAQPDEALTELREQTAAAYRDYVRAFGSLNRGTLIEGAVDEETGLPALSWRRPAMGGFRRDPDAALVMALEVFDQDTGEAVAAPILTRRVNRRPQRVDSAQTPAEALAISLGESGRVDLARIAGLLDLGSEQAAEDALGDLVFRDGTRLVSAAEFLSGNVREKLRRAQAHGTERAIAALRAVVPADLGPLDINIGLGSPFVRTEDVEAFLSEALGANWPRVQHVPEVGHWEVSDSHHDAASRMQFGTPRMTPSRLVEVALNARAPEVFDREWSPRSNSWVQVRNVEASAAANEKMELIRDRFSTWVWEDAERSERLCREYNDKLNSHVVRRFDGSGLTFPGMSDGFTPWAHQRSAVERIVSSERALIGHPVGSGKTATMILSAMTLRQFGLATKPMIVVPNHLLEQVAREAQQIVPTAKLLIATKDDLARTQRRLFAARCATGDWDAVIITHSAFTSIPVHPQNEQRWLQEQKLELRSALEGAGDSRAKGPKAIARAVRALDARIGKLRSGTGDADAIYFEQLGVDYILMDEAHLFRRLSTGSTSRDNGFGSGVSKRAMDLLVKVETLSWRKGAGKPVVAMLTGTPWSNTLAETWVWQRYLQPDLLRELDLFSFDAWVSAFVRYETAIEVAPDGSGFRTQRRPAGLVNVPELKTMLGQVADILDPEVLGLKRPKVITRNVTVPASPGQRSYVQELAERADDIRSKRAGKDDNMLLVVGDGRKVALDPRLVGIEEDSTKVAELARQVARAYHQNRDRRFGEHPTPGAFQLVFLDLGTPRPGESQTYGRLRRALVDAGVPASGVRFVHEATTDKARAALFASCRDGEVAVLIGSTPKVGMGTNVQTRLTHLWHGDAPWLPAEVIQRRGRGDRPGNLSDELVVTNMVTEGTFDAYTWQALERKSRSFDALYSTGSSAREVEDVSAATMSYGEVKALASGNPLLLNQAKARAEVKKLTLMRSVHLQSVRSAQSEAEHLTGRVQSLLREAENAKAGAGRATATDPLEREALLRLTSDVLKSARYSYGRAHWRGFDLHPRVEGKSLSSFDLTLDYSTLHSIHVPRAVVRRGPEKVVALVIESADKVIAALPTMAERYISEAQRLADRVADLQRAVAEAVFPDEDALQEAIARLASIDSAIAEEASAHESKAA